MDYPQWITVIVRRDGSKAEPIQKQGDTAA